MNLLKLHLVLIWKEKKLEDNLLLIGPPKSGKSTLVNILDPFKHRVHIIDGFTIGSTILNKNIPMIITSNHSLNLVGFRSVYIEQPSLESMYDLNLRNKLYNIRHRIIVECMKKYEEVIKN